MAQRAAGQFARATALTGAAAPGPSAQQQQLSAVQSTVSELRQSARALHLAKLQVRIPPMPMQQISTTSAAERIMTQLGSSKSSKASTALAAVQQASYCWSWLHIIMTMAAQAVASHPAHAGYPAARWVLTFGMFGTGASGGGGTCGVAGPTVYAFAGQCCACGAGGAVPAGPRTADPARQRNRQGVCSPADCLTAVVYWLALRQQCSAGKASLPWLCKNLWLFKADMQHKFIAMAFPHRGHCCVLLKDDVTFAAAMQAVCIPAIQQTCFAAHWRC